MSGEPQLTVAVRSAAQITPRLIAEKPAVLYVPLSELYEHPELTRMIGVETQLAAILPARGVVRAKIRGLPSSSRASM